MDVRVEITLPGGCKSYAIVPTPPPPASESNNENNNENQATKEEDKKEFTIVETVTEDMWRECYFSSHLRTVQYQHYPDVSCLRVLPSDHFTPQREKLILFHLKTRLSSDNCSQERFNEIAPRILNYFVKDCRLHQAYKFFKDSTYTETTTHTSLRFSMKNFAKIC